MLAVIKFIVLEFVTLRMFAAQLLGIDTPPNKHVLVEVIEQD